MNGLVATVLLSIMSTTASAAADQPTESILAQAINIAAAELDANGACLDESPLPTTIGPAGADPIANLLATVPAAPGSGAPHAWSASRTRRALRHIRRARRYGGVPESADDSRCSGTINVEPPRVSDNLFAVRIALRRYSAVIQRAYLFSADGTHIRMLSKTPEEIIVN